MNKFAIYFYADDLKFFKRSGRISNFAATMGTILGIHPIIYIDSEGVMSAISKGKGKMGSLKKLASYVEKLQEDIKQKDYQKIQFGLKVKGLQDKVLEHLHMF